MKDDILKAVESSDPGKALKILEEESGEKPLMDYAGFYKRFSSLEAVPIVELAAVDSHEI